MSGPGASTSAISPCESPPAILPEKGVGYLARQPILNRKGGVFGYELRHHQGCEKQTETAAGGFQGLIDALALFGAERFAGEHWAFVRCSAQMLLDDELEALPSSRMVLEIPGPQESSPKLLRCCRRLREAGFRLCLIDFRPGAGQDALLDYADYVKVETQFLATPEWERFSNRRKTASWTMIADNIQTQEAYRTARTAGFEYFQGFYFCTPDLIPNGTIPTNHLYHLEILRQLFKDPLDLKTLAPLVERDASLIYRVLRFVNSPICAIRQPVTSIELAIIILGDLAFRRIATLAIQCGLNRDHSPELLNMALVRARFCADAARLCGLDPEEQYLVGMLSMLPSMLCVPMAQILSGLPLREPIRDALAGVPVKERCLLAWIEELERDRIRECEVIAASFGLPAQELTRVYLGAMEAANSMAAAAK
jgi:c-di-GMP phosphodiesterase